MFRHKSSKFRDEGQLFLLTQSFRRGRTAYVRHKGQTTSSLKWGLLVQKRVTARFVDPLNASESMTSFI